MTDGVLDSAPPRRRTPISPIVIFVMTLILMMLLIQIQLDDQFYEDNFQEISGYEISQENWMFLIVFIMIVFIIVLLLVGFPARTAQPQTFTSQGQMVPVAPPVPPAEGELPMAEAMPANVVEAEPLVVEAEIVEAEPIGEEEYTAAAAGLKTKKPRLIEYPKKVPGGVYGDTIVRVDPRTKLNLRTLLIRSCMICDRQGKCWDEVQDSISNDEFVNNIDCKRGLRHLKGEGKAKVKKVKMMVRTPSEPAE